MHSFIRNMHYIVIHQIEFLTSEKKTCSFMTVFVKHLLTSHTHSLIHLFIKSIWHSDLTQSFIHVFRKNMQSLRLDVKANIELTYG